MQTYTPSFTVNDKKICLSLHYNGDNSCSLVSNKQIIKFKTTDSEIIAQPLCLASISEDFETSNITGLYGYVYDFSADYWPIANNKIHNIHAYLMGKKTIF